MFINPALSFAHVQVQSVVPMLRTPHELLLSKLYPQFWSLLQAFVSHLLNKHSMAWILIHLHKSFQELPGINSRKCFSVISISRDTHALYRPSTIEYKWILLLKKNKNKTQNIGKLE